MALTGKYSLLVVGGSGFIGSYVVKEGVKRGWDVCSLSLHQPNPRRRVPEANYIFGDIRRPESLAKLANYQFDFVVNLGGYIDHLLYANGGYSQIEVHFIGLLNLLNALDIKYIRRFVQIGSSDEYGNALAPQIESQRELPISPYSFGKVAATHFLQMLNRTESFPAVILRLFLTYGPGQDQNRFLPQIIKGCLSDDSFATSSGKQLRDFCYIDDTVNAIFSVLDANNSIGHVFNIASGQPVSIENVIHSVCKIIGRGRPQFGMLPNRPLENSSLYANIAKVQDLVGWSPTVNLTKGLSSTIDWFANEN